MRYPEAAGPVRRPLSALVQKAKAAKALCLDAETANYTLAPLVYELPVDQELERLLSRFGWSQSEGFFTRTLDLGSFIASLQMHNYIKGAVIGRGAYGSVHRAVHRESNTLHAIKQIRVTEYGLCESTLREISTLSALNHHNVVKLREVIAAVSGKNCYLVLELLDCDLLTYLRTRTAPIELPHVKLVPRLACDRLGADLLSAMLTYDPARRITAAQALQHPWFDDVRAAEQQAAEAAALATDMMA
ncbi:Cyclin-dependent kinase 1 [Tetrabaena socialis]|uniref:cyclin-dependent kinase n=1 Tax=Tetrabaena socialis TaxID=47790 RepID=A0A2J7ZYG1_9CHLO|nr:Cyclin-dependent kinase 1 [Tetrabaena socialis]|eukprot:PNH05286.1 Cyclin-dependent kinase 1 [Tetrabaena socialis]